MRSFPLPPLVRWVICIALLVSAGSFVEADDPQTNILILLADDLGWGDVGFHDGEPSTPHLDRLAKQSVELERFYAFPSCSAARAALLTGRFPHRFGITGPVRPRDEGLPQNEVLFTEFFQDAGYQTSLIGKWHLSHGERLDSHPTARGFDHFYGFMGSSIDYYQHVSSAGRLDWQRDRKPLDEDGYSTDLLADEAVRQIRDAGEKPFCMLLSFNAPHSPFQAPEELVAKYVDRLGQRRGTYAAMVEAMDAGIGRILKTIDDTGLRDNTIVVFASDNGAAAAGSNLPFRGYKRQVLEGGIHMPCLIRFPKTLSAGKSDQLSGIYDLFPTLASACGVDVDAGLELDGRDLWESLQRGKRESRDLVIAESEREFAYFSGPWKLIDANGQSSLYNLSTDPGEQEDLLAKQPDVAARLTEQLQRFRDGLSPDNPANRRESVAQLTSVTGEQEGDALADWALTGDAKFGVLGDKRVESSGRGIRLLSGQDVDGDGNHSGLASSWIDGVSGEGDRWYRFSVRGLAHDGFQVDKDDLFLRVEFFKNQRKDSLDLIKTRIYGQIEREREDFADEGTNRNLGKATWRTYSMEFRTPFPQVDSLHLSVGFDHGQGDGPLAEFWISDVALDPIAVPAKYAKRKQRAVEGPASTEGLVPLGGRWYFDPQGGDKQVPDQFDHLNSHQLIYLSARLERPFAGNTTSWLRAGYLDVNGDPVPRDRYIEDALVIEVTDDHLVMHSKNLPNHPTATFPDRWRMLDGNPAYIKEQRNTWYLPLRPEINPDHISMTAQNENGALPMGAVGVATNGVIFFNPFDHIFEADAVWRLDRCCGHPSPQYQYHYHKYPVCVKSPWTDDGGEHSPVIGFAFDGYPVYGPYESKGVLARDATENPINDFNLHEDQQRGPHYHVTPGKFPHIIGGYWGKAESLNRPRRRRNPS